MNNNEEYFDEEKALAELLNADVLFCNSRKYVKVEFKPKPDAKINEYGGYPLDQMDCVGGSPSEKETIVLFVNCNDVFVWGSADAEEIPLNQLKTLYDYHKKYKFGADMWCCIQRNEKPQDPLVEMMKKDNCWTSEMESLPENKYWTNLKNKNANKTI